MTVYIVSVSFVFLSEQLVKTSEVGRRPIYGFYCGDHIGKIYIAVCNTGINKRLKREYKGWFPYDRGSQIAIRSAIVYDHMETTSAIVCDPAIVIAEDHR